jgi:hypothetical protein
MASASDENRPPPRQAHGYWAESQRPMAGLVFIAPLLVVYELGVVVLGPESVRNGADVWLRELLECVGFGQYFLLPVVTVGILLCWHYTTREPWRFSSGIFWGMIVECVFLAFCLRLILQLQGALFGALAGSVAPATEPALVAINVSGAVRETVGFLGAGVYEELLFRLMLLPAVAWALRRVGMAPRASIILAVLSTSLMFAAAHYIGQPDEPFALTDFFFWFSFLFRFLAGVFFSVLFVSRGFGIAAGTHAGYDILVGLF